MMPSDLALFAGDFLPIEKKQQWPSRIVKGEKWDEIYQEGCQSIKGLMATVDEAIVWANDLIMRIEG